MPVRGDCYWNVQSGSRERVIVTTLMVDDSEYKGDARVNYIFHTFCRIWELAKRRLTLIENGVNLSNTKHLLYS